MSSNFKKRLQRLHGSRSRERASKPEDGAPRVFTAEGADGAVPQPRDPLEGVQERWRAVGAESVQTEHGEAFYLPRTHRQNHRHGKRRLVEGAAIDLERLRSELEEAPAHSLDPARLAYLDLETNGLSKSSYPFCIGIGLWQGTSFDVHHYLMTSEEDEPAALAAAANLLSQAEGLVTFNGHSFDVKMLRRRFAHHQVSSPLGSLPHLDLLLAVRQLLPERKSNKLSKLEEDLLGFERHGDIPGAKIPGRWQTYLDTGEPKTLLDVFDHNRLDILTMVVLMAELVGRCSPTSNKSRDPAGAGRARRERSRPDRPESDGTAAPKSSRGGKIASRLSRTYELRRRATQPAQPAEPAPAEEPAKPDKRASKRDSVELKGSFSRGKLRRGMPVGARLRELRGQVERLLDEASDAEALAKLHEMAALAPRNPFALEKLAEWYRRDGQPEIGAHFERRLGETSPF